jgi:hypothetical protein
MADFSPVAPGWSATFDSGPAIAWGVIFGAYQAEFGLGGSVAIAAPGGMQLSGMLTSGVAFSFPSGDAVILLLRQPPNRSHPTQELTASTSSSRM